MPTAASRLPLSTQGWALKPSRLEALDDPKLGGQVDYEKNVKKSYHSCVYCTALVLIRFWTKYELLVITLKFSMAIEI